LLAVTVAGGDDPGHYIAAYDANGNITEYVDATGAIIAHRDYGPFGETTALSGPMQNAFTHWWSTKPWDPVTGLSEYQFRMYSPELGRWLSRDPIGEDVETGAANLYGFVENGPVNKIDFLGLFSKIVNCCPCEEATLKTDETKAQEHITHLKSIINGWIPLIESSPGSMKPKPGYPKYTIHDLKKALAVLDKASAKLNNGVAECSKEDKYIASAWPWGNTVTVYEPYWFYTEFARGAHLLHEGTHMGAGTTDAAYFWQNGDAPHNTFFFNFSQIASTYDTWVLMGFCIPGYNCPTTGKAYPKGIKLAERVCPLSGTP
jgi:RHS repeat-associated protein